MENLPPPEATQPSLIIQRLGAFLLAQGIKPADVILPNLLPAYTALANPSPEALAVQPRLAKPEVVAAFEELIMSQVAKTLPPEVVELRAFHWVLSGKDEEAAARIATLPKRDPTNNKNPRKPRETPVMQTKASSKPEEFLDPIASRSRKKYGPNPDGMGAQVAKLLEEKSPGTRRRLEEALAAELGISRKAIQSFLAGRAYPTVNRFNRILHYLEVPPEEAERLKEAYKTERNHVYRRGPDDRRS